MPDCQPYSEGFGLFSGGPKCGSSTRISPAAVLPDQGTLQGYSLVKPKTQAAERGWTKCSYEIVGEVQADCTYSRKLRFYSGAFCLTLVLPSNCTPAVMSPISLATSQSGTASSPRAQVAP